MLLPCCIILFIPESSTTFFVTCDCDMLLLCFVTYVTITYDITLQSLFKSKSKNEN